MVFSLLRRWRERWRIVSSIPIEVAQEPLDDDTWFFPPQNVHDRAGWDRYWHDQVSHGLTPPMFDLFCNDVPLIQCLRKREGRTVLCVGNGISQEPRALAAAGFEVAAIDLSPIAMEIAEAWGGGRKQLKQSCTWKQRGSGGSVNFVVGDFLDGKLCPGPFDAIIERRTLQLFTERERGAALDALILRLRTNGLFLSHCHDATWRPPAEPIHPVEQFFRERGWRIFRSGILPDHPGRLAWLMMSTG